MKAAIFSTLLPNPHPHRTVAVMLLFSLCVYALIGWQL